MPPQAGMLNACISRAVIGASLFMLAGGCVSMKPPVKNGGPARSEKGIQVEVLRQSCSQTQDPDQDGWDLVAETVEIQVRNGSPEAATVHRDKFRLLTPDGGALRTLTWRSADPLTVPGGASHTLRLDPDAGITLHESPVAFEPVAFVPHRNL
jgi:hypothetical protein